MKLLLTGADGFIARNLRWRLQEAGGHELVLLTRATAPAQWPALLQGVQAVLHLAGVNRPPSPDDYAAGNADFTATLCTALRALPQPPAVLFASSTQAALDNPYGRSKAQAEAHLAAYAAATGAAVCSYRLPNVFGKWSRPHYNSAVATFCHNIARGLPIQVHNPDAALTLVYVDDLADEWLAALKLVEQGQPLGQRRVMPEYATTVGALAAQVQAFAASRQSLVSERVGTGLTRALYATYVSFLPPEAFDYGVARHGDPRGVFVEMLKTPDAGQFSFFTAHPGITRGGHYHHSKTEKFLVIKGQARFKFRHIDTGERHELLTSGDEPRIVETVPGWTHDITNIGSDELVVMLWANEIFDRQRPDTVAMPV